jgi:hypothetical protein
MVGLAGLLVVLGKDGEDNDGGGCEEGPGEEGEFADAGCSLGCLAGRGIVVVVALVGEEGALFGRLRCTKCQYSRSRLK